MQTHIYAHHICTPGSFLSLPPKSSFLFLPPKRISMCPYYCIQLYVGCSDWTQISYDKCFAH